MDMREFENQYRKYRWFYLLDVPEVRDFVSSYNNKHTKILVCKSLDIFVKEAQKDREDFSISDIF